MSGLVRRAWALPYRAHVVALALVLLALVPVVGTSASFSTDEGAAIVQARSLARGDGWVVEHPVPQVDPEGRHYPLEGAEYGPRGYIAFGKHPVYALMLAGVDRLGGVTAMVLLSLAGTVAAAGLAGLLARRLGPGLDRPVLWVAGLASPLLFDGFLVMGHSLGAAFAAAAVLAAVVALERRSVAVAAAVAPLAAGAVLVRNESAFLVLGLAVAMAAVAVARRSHRLTAAVMALAAVAAGASAHLLEIWWLARLKGAVATPVRPAPAADEPVGYLAGRWVGFVRTVLSPTYGGDRGMSALLLIMAIGVVATAVFVRTSPERRRPIAAAAFVATLAAVGALLRGPRTVVLGLLVAFPLAAAGLVLVRRATLRTTAARIAFGVFGIFALCVVATQYAIGGAVEWGGRYFAVGLPLLVPVLVLAVKEPVRDRWVAGSLVVCSVVLATMAVGSLRFQHRRLAQLVATAEEVGREVAATEQGEPPVLISTYGSVPRWAWRTYDEQRWLTTGPDDLPGLLARLRSSGIGQVGLVTANLPRDGALLGGSTVVSLDSPPLACGWHVLVLRLA